MRYKIMTVRRAIIQKTIDNSIDEDMKKREPLSTVSGNEEV